jgi:hypothetical protein
MFIYPPNANIEFTKGDFSELRVSLNLSVLQHTYVVIDRLISTVHNIAVTLGTH